MVSDAQASEPTTPWVHGKGELQTRTLVWRDGLVAGLVFPDLSSRRRRSSAAYGADARMGGRCRVMGGSGLAAWRGWGRSHAGAHSTGSDELPGEEEGLMGAG